MKINSYMFTAGSLLPTQVEASYAAVFDNQASELSKILDDLIPAVGKALADPQLSGQGRLAKRNTLGHAALAAVDTLASKQKVLATDLKKAVAGLPQNLPNWTDLSPAAAQRQAEIRQLYPLHPTSNLAVRDALLNAASSGDLETVQALALAPSPVRAAWRLTQDDIKAAIEAFNLKTKPEQSATLRTIQIATALYESNTATAKRLIANACGCSVEALMDLPPEGAIPMSGPQPKMPAPNTSSPSWDQNGDTTQPARAVARAG